MAQGHIMKQTPFHSTCAQTAAAGPQHSCFTQVRLMQVYCLQGTDHVEYRFTGSQYISLPSVVKVRHVMQE